MLREAAGIRTNASEVTIRNETGATGKAGLTRAYSESAFNLSGDDQLQLQILDALAKDGNVEIVAHPTVSTVPGARNGVYFEGNTIHIGLDAIDRAYVQTGMHEIVHWLRGNNADGYGGVAQTVFDALTRAGEDVSALIREKLTAYAQADETLDFEAAQEEVVAESAALVLTDQRNMRAFAREHADAFSAFMDAFVRFWEKLQSIARSVAKKNKTGEQQALIGQNKTLQKIYDVLMDAVRAAGQQSGESGNGYTSYSLNELSDDQKYSYAALTAKQDLKVVVLDTSVPGRTRSEVVDAALADAEKHASGHDQNNAPMVYVGDIDKLVIVGKKGVEHGLGGARFKAQAAVVEKIGEILSNSISINEAFPKKDGVRNTWILMGAAQDSNGTPVYVRSIVNQSTGHLENVSALYAVNGKKDEAGHNKNVPNAWDSSLGVSSSFTISVADMLDAVKEKFSDVLSADVISALGVERKTSEFTPMLKYSLNQTETDAFKDWFGDWQNDAENASKIVDEDGAPLIVYHGSDAQFNTFDMRKGRSTMDIVGSFFSPWEIDAAGYGENVGAYYLNIRNPAPEGVAYAALNSFKGQNEAGQKARDYLIKMGYDGVNNGGEEFIAFYPNQIKSATDNVGTFDSGNADVRYSINAPFDETITLSDQEMAIAMSRIGQISKGLETDTPRAENGDYIIDINDKLIYASGDIEEPHINRVIQIDVGNESVTDEARQFIYDAEREGWEGDYALQIYKAVFGEGTIRERDFRFGTTYAGQDGRGEGSDRGEADRGDGSYSLNPAIIDDYNRGQFVNTAVDQIMERGSRAPAIMRALAQMGEGARYAYAPNGGTGGGGEYANPIGGMNPNGTGADGDRRSMRNPIEITTDLVRSVNAGLNPGGAKTVNGRARLPRAVAGFYAPMANYITTDRRYAGQLAVNLHEFGHAISRTQDFNAVPPGYDAEYAAFLSQYPQEARGQEAIAAFAADYMVEPQRARNIAGDAYVDDFEAMLRTNPRLNAAIQKARAEIDLWKSATVAERIANSIRDADEAETRSTARSRSLIRRFYGAVFDAADAAKDVSGDLYTAVRYANASRRRADTILTDRLVDYRGTRVGDSLAEVLRKAGIHQDNEMDMLTYAVARHAIEWYNEGLARRAENPRASGMEVFADGEVSINDLRMLVFEYERTNPTAVRGADALVGWWREFRDTWYVGTGLMTEEMAQELDRKYPNYVPFNRFFDNLRTL